MARTRSLLALTAAVVLATAGCGGAADETTEHLGTPTAARAATWEAALTAGSATVATVDGPASGGRTTAVDQVLRLRGVHDEVTVFTDRPRRLAGQLTPVEFAALWHGGAFGSDPPNAAVVLDGEVVAVELSAAVLDPTRSVLLLAVERLERRDGAPAGLLPEGEFESVALFVDAFPTEVNGQVTDAVTQTNVKVLSAAPATAMGQLYQSIAASAHMANQVMAEQPDPATPPTSSGAAPAGSTPFVGVRDLDTSPVDTGDLTPADVQRFFG